MKVEMQDDRLRELIAAVEEVRDEAVSCTRGGLSHLYANASHNALEEQTERRLDLALSDVKAELG